MRGRPATTERPALDTPAVIVDLDIAERNIARLQQACDENGIANWPHIKTHKSVELARLQLRHGAAGITCQKLGEAEIMAEAGFGDILISYNVLGAPKLARLARLARRTRLTLSCDSAPVADGLSDAAERAGAELEVLVECDTGRHRCGVPDPRAAAALAGHIARLPGLRFSGLLLYPPNDDLGHTAAFVRETKALCVAQGLEVRRVSSGGTPNVRRLGALGETEYRAGTYVYNDRQMVTLAAAALDDCALFVHTTVVSHPEPDRVIIDAGSKTLTSDLMGLSGFGSLVDYPEARIHQLAEEHGFVDISACSLKPELGEVVRVLPNHACPVSNLFDTIATIRNGEPAGVLKIDARGRTA
jgi:D-serine deaminase-like pyridoxal phosphate-dependent protein